MFCLVCINAYQILCVLTRGAKSLLHTLADLVLASDVLYEKQTAEAMAQRVVEARQQNCDIGRPNRKVFIEKLAGLRPEESSEFASSGTAVQRVGGTEAGRTKVELLELPPDGPASEALAIWPPAVLSRPSNHGHADAEDLAIMALAEADQLQLALALCRRPTQGPGTTALLMACEQHGHDQEERRVLSGLADALPEEVAVLLRKTSAGLLSSAQLNIPTVAITRASSSYRKELSLLRRALHVEPNSPDAVLEAMVDFGQELGEAGAWAKFAGGSKAQSLLAALRGAAPSRTAGPPEVLEIGTYCSYSAISIVTASSAQVTSIEIDPVLVAIARGIIAHAGLSTRVRVWTGHSRLLLPLLMKRRWQERPTAPWFIDRWGTQYPEDLDFVEKLRLLRPSGALLVADNVLRTAAAHFLWRLSTDKVQQPSGKLQRIFASRTVEVNEVGDASDVDWMSVSVTLRGIPDEQALIREQVPDELEEMPNARVVALWNVDICNVCPSSCVCGRQRQAALFRLRRSRTLCDRRKLCLNLLGLGLHDEDQEDAGRISAFADIDVPYRVEPPGQNFNTRYTLHPPPPPYPMSVASLVSSISGYLPAGVRDAAGLSPQISEAVRHITWLSLERALWPPEIRGVPGQLTVSTAVAETPRQLLVVGYTDGFQLWDLQDPTAAKELVSKYDKAVLQARLLPLPLLPASEQTEPGESFLGVSAAPLMAYLHKGSPALVRLFSLRSHDDVHLLRLTEPARSLQAGRRFFAVGFAKQVELYDALQFHALFSVQCHGAAGPTFALSHRWLAYNLPPHVMVSTGSSYAGPQPGLPGKPRLPAVVKDGLEYLGQVGQRTLDQVLMPPTTAPESAASQGSASLRSGSVAVRDVETQTVISQFEDHAEAVECMVWDPSGLQLVTCAALGHRILVHRAVLGKGHALTLDSGKDGPQLGSLTFQHVFTLSRGLTPAVISNIAISDDSQFVAVSSAKGTTHVFRLPSFHSHRHQLLETGAVVVPGMAGVDTGPVNLSVCTRVRLGSVLLQEGLMPHSSFFLPRVGRGVSSGPTFPWIYVATRAGSLTVYSLHLTPSSFANTSTDPGSGETSDGPGSEEWSTCLQRETRICRPLRHFNERRLSARDGETTSARSGPPRSSGSGAASAASPRQRGSPRHGADLSPAATTRSDEGVSKWLAFAETATHVSTQVPLWLCPQLRVFAYPPDVSRDHLNASLRAGAMVPGQHSDKLQNFTDQV
eukprot:s550_g1.t9